MNSDFRDLLCIFAEEEVEYLIVGGYAVIHYAQPRYTKDLDIWLCPSDENAQRLMRAFARFGIPLIDVTEADFAEEGLQYLIGTAPVQIDFLTSLPGVPAFQDAWAKRSTADIDGLKVEFLGRHDLITAKETAGRAQDLADLEELGNSPTADN